MSRILELCAFCISAAAFTFGATSLFRKGVPKYFKLYVCAAGCYMLEELWAVVNMLFGNGAQDGLVTVRLFGFFGCLCFMLSANANEFDLVVDDGSNRKAKLLSLCAPVLLLVIYALYVIAPADVLPLAVNIAGLVSLSPALFAARYSLKHLLLPEDAMGFLKAVRGIDIISLIFYTANYIYPFADLYCSKIFMGVYDVVLALMLFVLIMLCRKGAQRWKTLI